MINEDYVSFETAKLLKEKGFDEYCLKNYWSTDKELHNWGWELSYHRNSDRNRNTKDCVAPTLQMAAKWLREVHKLFIFISTWLMHENNVQYYFEIREIKTSDFETLYDYTSEELNSPEKATEVAIKYCLEHLL